MIRAPFKKRQLNFFAFEALKLLRGGKVVYNVHFNLGKRAMDNLKPFIDRGFLVYFDGSLSCPNTNKLKRYFRLFKKDLSF